MTDLEFDVLDELYFVTEFCELKKATNLPLEEIQAALLKLHCRGWIKIYRSMSDEISDQHIDLDKDFQNYFYLATKEGLLAHNGR